MTTSTSPISYSKGQETVVAIAAIALLAFSFVFGGASRDHALRLALVELAALPLLVMALSQVLRDGDTERHKFALGLLAAAFALPLIQLIPLPPAIWTGLPGRAELVLALDLAGLQPGWNALSLTPDRTWWSILALLPPAAAFLGMLVMPEPWRSRLVWGVVAATAVAILLGAAQLVSGGTQLYPWATTAAGNVTGFFANRNHLATLILSVTPFVIVLGAGHLRGSRSRGLPIWIAALFLGLALVGLAAIRSRFGVLLFVPVMCASLVAAWIASGRGRPPAALLGLVGAAALGLALVVAMALGPVMARFDTGAPELRFERWPMVAEAAEPYLPLGSGIGSFDSVYRAYEPLEQLDASFFNQAHNEYLETWLEAGWPGVALIVAFLIWFGRRAWSIWRAAPSRTTDLGRAASIAVALMLVHSIADYPLRTATLAVLFALCCALMEGVPRAGQGGAAASGNPRRAAAPAG